MEFESTNSGTTAKLPILKLENGDSWVSVPQTTQENGTSVTKMSIPVTAEEKKNKKNDVKARATKKTQKTLLKQEYENFSASSGESLDSILPPKWNTHVVVWMNKPEVETMSIDDLYKNFKIIKQKVKKSVGTSRGAQNLAFMTAPTTSSTNDANTASPQVSAACPNVNAASPQVCSAIVSDNIVYAFMVENPNGSNVLHLDLEQIHEDDLEAIDLKWQLSLLSVRAKKYYQSIGKKIFINTNDTAGYDKSKVECIHLHKLGHFARECKAPRSKEGQFRNQDNTRKQGNNKDTSLKAMLAIDGVGFDWSDMAEEQVQTNMALMAFSDSELYTLIKLALKHGKPQHDDKGFVDSGCSRHMTGNIKLISQILRNLWRKQHRASCKPKVLNPITKPLFMLHMDLFGPTFDETSEILKNFIKEKENLVDKKVKIIRSDNGTEFKNRVMDDFYKEKGIISNDSVGTSEEISQDCIMVPSNENAEQDKFADDSSTKDVNAVGQHVNTASPDVNTSSLKLNTIGSSVNIASSNEHDSPKDMFTIGVSSTLEATHIESFNNEDEPEVDLGKNTNSYAVPTTPNTRIHKDHPIDNVIGDVKSSVQTRRMTKPTSEQGFLSEIEPTSIDGKNGFKRGKIDQTLFIKKQKGDILLVQVYVDDIIFGSTNKELCTGFEKLMKDKFQMSSMGELTFFLGLQVQQKEDGIFISQDKYVAEILKKFNYSDVKSASTPVDLEKPLVKDGDADDVDVHLYRSMIGSLMYLTASRPDIMFAVCACARFQVTPKTSHLLAVKRIFRYLKGKPTLGLWYSRDSPFELVAYTDSDYAGATQDRKSTTGGCMSKEVGTPRYLSLEVPLTKVGDEAVHKELGDRMERDATTTSSLEAEQDSCSGPRRQDTILGDVDAQNRFEITSKQSNDPPLSRGYTLGSGEDSIELLELMEFFQVLAAEEGTDCLPNATIFEELARMGCEKPSQKLTFYKAFFSLQLKYFIHTITQCLSAKSTAWNEFSSSMASLIICLAINQKFNLS
ncbi:uncharacterized mitochondrial protein-like protein [Tanacetum coccineum]